MKIKKGDIIVIVGLILLSFGINFAINKAMSGYEGDMLVVEQNGKVIKKLPILNLKWNMVVTIIQL